MSLRARIVRKTALQWVEAGDRSRQWEIARADDGVDVQTVDLEELAEPPQGQHAEMTPRLTRLAAMQTEWISDPRRVAPR